MSDDSLSGPYPRDLIGYGRNPPHAQWPGGARIAVQFVLNYEEGGECCILDGDPSSECLLSEIVGAQPWKGQRNLNMESIYEYGARSGFWRLWRAFTRRNMPVTVYGVTLAMARNPEAVAAMKEADWEIASHGYRWIDYQYVDEAVERGLVHDLCALGFAGAQGGLLLAHGKPFGTSGDILFWIGVGSDVNACSKANGLLWFDNKGAGFFGGSLSAGIRRNAYRSTAVSTAAARRTTRAASW